MQPLNRKAYPPWAYGPLGGAVLAVALAFAYTLLFIAYATIRSSLLVIRVNPDAGVPGTVIAYFFTLAVPALVIAAMMAVPAALVGLVTAPILKRVVHFLNPRRSEQRAIGIGAATCFTLAVLLLIGIQRALGFALADVAANPETFLLWYALPTLIFIGAGAAAARALNRVEAQKLAQQVEAHTAKAAGTNLSAA